jgi:hypothetical protein
MMALSDYDTLAFNSDGKCTIGKFTNDKGTTIEIYKNWLYISNPEMSTSNSDFLSDVIAQVNSGNLTIGGWNINAMRGKQNSIMFIASYYSISENKTYYVGGIGCSGYKDDVAEAVKKLGLNPRYKWYMCSSSSYKDGNWTCKDIITRYTKKGVEEHTYRTYTREEESYEWLGVTEETLKQWFNMAKRCCDYKDFRKWLRKCQESKTMRYNQGDMFFAEHIDPSMRQMTEIGEAKTPKIMDMIKEQTTENENTNLDVSSEIIEQINDSNSG